MPKKPVIKQILPNKKEDGNTAPKVIQTGCNLVNMLEKLVLFKGDFTKLTPLRKACYKAYLIDEIKDKILSSPKSEWKRIIIKHILSKKPSELGANIINVYLVAYVGENLGSGKEKFFEFLESTGISNKSKSAQTIWQTGIGDGVFLGILEDSGDVSDWNLIVKWVNG